MNVEILHIDECPSWVEAGSRVRAALDTLGMSEVDIDFSLVSTPAEAAAVPFAGSPTILIDGSDAFPGGAASTELACRIYPTDQGFAGVPTLEQVTDAIRRHART